MMLRRFRFCLVSLLILLCSVPAHACVGRLLYVGALDRPEEKLMAEIFSLLINERTGTTVKVRYFENSAALYAALRSKVEAEQVNIIMEDTADAAEFLKMARLENLDAEYVAVKKRYEEELDVVWLKPFGFNRKGPQAAPAMSAPLVRRDVLAQFPLLPRVLNKLAGTITDEVLSGLLARVDGGEKPSNVAHDFLKTAKLI